MKKKRIAPSERMEQEPMDGLVSEADPLGEAVRRGAQLILQRALEAEACLRAPHRQVSDFWEEIATSGAARGRYGATAMVMRTGGCTAPKGPFG